MSEQLIDLVKIAGITVLVTLLWAGSIGITYWDLHRRSGGGIRYAWLIPVVFLPFLGLILYLLYRVSERLLAPGRAVENQEFRRRTMTKPRAARELTSATLVAEDIAAHVIYDPANYQPETPGRTNISPTFVFSVVSGAEQGKEFLIQSLPAVIGRGADTVIRLDQDLGVSRKHAELYEQGGSLRIRDLRSTHGTQVNGLRIDDQTLSPGDRIQVGMTVLAFRGE